MTHPVIFNEAIKEKQRLESEGNVVESFVENYCYRMENRLGLGNILNPLQYAPNSLILKLLQQES